MARLITLAETSKAVAAATARSAKIETLAAHLRQLDPAELAIAVRYLSGETRQGRIGIGYSALRASAAAAADDPSLQLCDVDRYLEELAAVRGAGSAARRAALLREMFGRATGEEQDFLLRLLTGELRQGALSGVMIEAIAAAVQLPLAELRRAAMYANDLGVVARVAVEEGAAGLQSFQLQTMSPIVPMLAQTAVDVEEALERLAGDVAFDWKLDGARIQLHKRGDDIRVFTRSLNDVTSAIPEIVEAARALPAEELVLDGEAICLAANGRPYPFQTTMRRFGRKLDVERLRDELPMRAFYFDCLRWNERSLADRPMRERIAALVNVVPQGQLIPRCITRSLAEAQAFYESALAQGHEGVMAKSLDAPYEAGNRGASWLKIKRVHTLDLVVLAAEWGHGRRAGKLSNLHLGALDPATGQYVMLGKTFKGLTDAMLDWQTQEFLARELRRDEWTVYVRPDLVVEIAFSDLQASPRYPGGIALRLARVKRYRTDKFAAEADTMETVRELFRGQGAEEEG
jgi:DNA ligase-1